MAFGVVKYGVGGEGGPNFYETYIFALRGSGLIIQFLKQSKNIKKWISSFFQNLAPPGKGLIIEIWKFWCGGSMEIGLEV